MSEERSRPDPELRSDESWLASATGDGAEGEREQRSLLRAAALARAAFDATPVPHGAEERAYAAAMREWERVHGPQRGRSRFPAGPRLFGRVGHWMRFVFTLGRRR